LSIIEKGAGFTCPFFWVSLLSYKDHLLGIRELVRVEFIEVDSGTDLTIEIVGAVPVHSVYSRLHNTIGDRLDDLTEYIVDFQADI